MKFEKIKAGDTLYDVHSYRMGNTTIRTVGVWSVRVVEVNHATRCALVSWNGNMPEMYSERTLTRLKTKEPVLERGVFGSWRIAKRSKSGGVK